LVQELSSTFARLCHLVDETTAEMRTNMTHIDRTLKQLQEPIFMNLHFGRKKIPDNFFFFFYEGPADPADAAEWLDL
jgi:hypothetical protein